MQNSIPADERTPKTQVAPANAEILERFRAKVASAVDRRNSVGWSTMEVKILLSTIQVRGDLILLQDSDVRERDATIATQRAEMNLYKLGAEQQADIIRAQRAEIERQGQALKDAETREAEMLSALKLMHGMGQSVFQSYDASLYDPAMDAAETVLAKFSTPEATE